jgi:hypothetical protein
VQRRKQTDDGGRTARQTRCHSRRQKGAGIRLRGPRGRARLEVDADRPPAAPGRRPTRGRPRGRDDEPGKEGAQHAGWMAGCITRELCAMVTMASSQAAGLSGRPHTPVGGAGVLSRVNAA